MVKIIILEFYLGHTPEIQINVLYNKDNAEEKNCKNINSRFIDKNLYK